MVTGLLEELLRGHGLAVERSGDLLRIPTLAQTWEAAIVRELEYTVQLDVRIELWQGRTLVESVTGLGRGAEAQADAIAAFARGPFHALLDAFGVGQGDQVERETWGPFAATIGSLNVRGTISGSAAGWFPALRAFVEQSGLASGTHWIRVFHANDGGARAAFEVLLDNAMWPEAIDALGEADFPGGEGWVSVRAFVVLRGGLDVTELAAAMVASSDDDVLARFGAAAWPAIDWLPLAFGRVLLDRLGVAAAPIAVVDGEERVLVDDPVYRACAAHARVVGDAGPAELFRALAMRSSEVDAVNQALHAGAQPGDLELSPPVLQSLHRRA
jgi:hypothetical protein